MKNLQIQGLTCQYQNNIILQNLSLNVEDNEIICLLGASGCGKTTLLKAIAGLLPLAKGDIIFNGINLGNLPAEERNMGFIFQDYALFPHLTVKDNIQFGLHHQSQEEKQQILQSMLELVHLQGLEKRYPHELSGGQQQRVAIARALACQPYLLLLDEPFSNIDTQVRQQMIDEMKAILKKQKISAIFVTHSKAEAFAFADKLAVMQDGKIVQIGSTDSLYHKPNSQFVADFLGETNYVPCKMDEHHHLHWIFGQVKVDSNLMLASEKKVPLNTEIYCLIRPHQMSIKLALNNDCALVGEVLKKCFLGQIYQYEVSIDNLILNIQSPENFHVGDRVVLDCDLKDFVLFDKLDGILSKNERTL